MYKVSKAQCLLPKSELGLGAWDLISKAEGLRTKWCLKLIQGKINHYLEDALERMEEMYRARVDSQVHIWNSRYDHSFRLTQATGSIFFGNLQASWARVIRRAPAVKKGDYVVALDEDTQPGEDSLWAGYGHVVGVTATKVYAKWFNENGTPMAPRATTMDSPKRISFSKAMRDAGPIGCGPRSFTSK